MDTSIFIGHCRMGRYKNVRALIDHQSNTISWLTMQIYEGKVCCELLN